MSETNIFGDDSMDFKSNFDNPRVVAEAYDLISNAYGDACNEGSVLKPFLKSVNSEVGSLQGSLDNISASDVESYDYFPAEEQNGHMVPEGFEVDPVSEQKERNIKILQRQLRQNLGESDARPAGNSEPVEPESDDNGNDESNDNDQNTHPVCEIPGVGNGTAEKVATFFDSNPEAVSEILEAADTVESFETAEVDRLAEVAGEQRAMQLRELFPEKSDEALIAFEQG